MDRDGTEDARIFPMPPFAYPHWKSYPVNRPAPEWAEGVLTSFRNTKKAIDSIENHGVSSNEALAALRPELEELGFQIEKGPNRISRPVLFKENGGVEIEYRVDGFHPDHGIVLEVEAGRGAANNADYRDLVRTSLMVDSKFLVLAMMIEYRGGGQTTRSFENARKRLDAIYASDRLKLPLDGILLIGY
jgi:hypothetical protein